MLGTTRIVLEIFFPSKSLNSPVTSPVVIFKSPRKEIAFFDMSAGPVAMPGTIDLPKKSLSGN